MLATPIRDRRAWTGRTLAAESWYYPLSASCLACLEQSLWGLPDPVTALRATEEQRAACRPCLEPVRDALEHGSGIAVVDRLPVERHTPAQAQALYWLVGELLGRPFAQNVQGTLLYDVRDTGQDVRTGVRYSVTNAETGFHTDNSFGATVLDYVGLLCLHDAREGGLSQLISGYAVYNELAERDPDALAVLCRPFHVDRRGGVRPGEGPTARVPVIERRGTELTYRYLRYWIHAGHEKAGEPLTPAQTRALAALEEALARPELRLEFPLRPGQMLFTNNRWLLHNRTAFQDYPEPERRRHLVRLWLAREEGELPPSPPSAGERGRG
jgi:alpha-ketoglutarate-dependent taurine dioxygenase